MNFKDAEKVEIYLDELNNTINIVIDGTEVNIIHPRRLFLHFAPLQQDRNGDTEVQHPATT